MSSARPAGSFIGAAALVEKPGRNAGRGDAILLSVVRDNQERPPGSSRTPAPASEDQLPFVFNRFRTGDRGQSRGAGLGLPVRSAFGKGSEFKGVPGDERD